MCFLIHASSISFRHKRDKSTKTFLDLKQLLSYCSNTREVKVANIIILQDVYEYYKMSMYSLENCLSVRANSTFCGLLDCFQK